MPGLLAFIGKQFGSRATPPLLSRPVQAAPEALMPVSGLCSHSAESLENSGCLINIFDATVLNGSWP